MARRRPLFWEAIGLVNPTSRARAEYLHGKRSKRARSIDELHNAPIALDVEEWAKKPNRLDFPGVDTMSYHRRLGKARRAVKLFEKKGLVKTFSETMSLSRGVAGRYSWPNRKIEVRPNLIDFPETIAHELGHAQDIPHFRRLKQPILKEAQEFATRYRPEHAWYFKGRPREAIAETIGSYLIQPRATKREVKSLAEILQA